jgi:NDP-sugar pyrophosphorylase family protein
VTSPAAPRALVLCAGAGSRLRALAGDRPKPLVPVAGVPVLDRILAWLTAHGVRDVAVNLHHGAGALREHLGDGRRFGVQVTYSDEPTLLGTAGACVPLADFLSERFVVVYGDVLTDLDLGALLAFHVDRAALLTLSLYDVPNPTECGIVALDGAGRITRFVEKPAPDGVFSTLASAGVLVAEPALLAHIPTDRPSDFGHDLVPALLAAGAPVYGWPIPAGTTVVDMGTPEGYVRAESWLAPSPAPRPGSRIS